MKKRVLAITLIAGMCLTSCRTKNGDAMENFISETVLTVEAESGQMQGNVYASKDNVSSKGEFATGFKEDNDMCTVNITMETEGFYDLYFTIRTQGGSFKSNFVYVDGKQIGQLDSEGKDYADYVTKRVFLTAGEHTVGLAKYWGYFDWDKLTVATSAPLSKDFYKVSAKLCNKDASDNTKRVMSFLCDNYGTKILSGQYCDGGFGSWEGFVVRNNNGGLNPAVVGLEMGDLCKTGVNNDFVHESVKAAKDYWKRGGIVTVCYHWLAPEKYLTGIWWNGFRKEAVNIPLQKIADGEDEEGLQLLLDDIDILAEGLKELRDEDIPVLFRPLHEAAGGWFWWGAYGADAYIKLYKIMYDRLTNYHGLNNLIWVWNGQSPDWYPGDEYCDIVGVDIYPGEHQYSSHIDSFLSLKSWTGENKIVVLSENGTLPDIDECVRDGAMWGFYCTWGGEFVLNDGLAKSYSEQYTEIEKLKETYANENVINLEDMPDLTTYPIRKE